MCRTYQEIWAVLLGCAYGDKDVAFSAFYPEFYHALLPGTASFYEASAINHDSSLSWEKRDQLMLHHPDWGVNVNIAGCFIDEPHPILLAAINIHEDDDLLFDYETFVAYMGG